MKLLKILDDDLATPYLLLTLFIVCIVTIFLSNSDFIKNNQRKNYCISIQKHNKNIELYSKDKHLTVELIDYVLTTANNGTEFKLINSILVKNIMESKFLTSDIDMINDMCQTSDKETFLKNLLLYSKSKGSLI